MYCRYCGTQLADNTAFCIKCGKKTVKLHPRTVAPLASAEPAGVKEKALAAAKKAWKKVKGYADEGRKLAKKAWAAVKNLRLTIPDYANRFSPGMWTACGILVGLILVMTVETIGALGARRLLFPVFKEIPGVWIPAWLICLLIALVTVIRGYNYSQTEEYKAAVAASKSREKESGVLAVDPGVLDDLGGITGSETAEPLGTEREKTPISQEAADIIAELEKLSLNL